MCVFIVRYFINMIALWPYLIQTGIFKQHDCNISTWRRNLNNPYIGLRGFLLALLICNFVYITTIHAIIGFDCGSNQSNIDTLSLLEVGECDLPKSQVIVERTYIQL